MGTLLLGIGAALCSVFPPWTTYLPHRVTSTECRNYIFISGWFKTHFYIELGETNSYGKSVWREGWNVCIQYLELSINPPFSLQTFITLSDISNPSGIVIMPHRDSRHVVWARFFFFSPARNMDGCKFSLDHQHVDTEYWQHTRTWLKIMFKDRRYAHKYSHILSVKQCYWVGHREAWINVDMGECVRGHTER